MIERHLSCLGPSGFHRVVYSEYPGPAGAPTLLCVHGLTRNGKDFDAIAETLSARYRVICPDMPGRGRSEWLKNPAEYAYPLYVQDCAALIARLDVDNVDWLGTSMGGIIGMIVASQPGTPIRKLVLNDIGPFLAKAGLERIASYVGLDPTFPSLEAFEEAIRKLAASFGPLTDDQWRKMAKDTADKSRMADGASPTIPPSPTRSRPGRSRTWTCGRCGTPSSPRRWSCAGPSPIS